MATIIGRKEEQKQLMDLYESGKAEFLAVYGRRRVGKTFLVRETLRDKITFFHTGLSIYEDEKPGITAFTGNETGSPLSIEESNTVPSIKVPL